MKPNVGPQRKVQLDPSDDAEMLELQRLRQLPLSIAIRTAVRYGWPKTKRVWNFKPGKRS